MKRFFLFVFTFLLSFALIRSCLGKEPLTFSAFMKALSKLDLDFSNIKKVSEYMAGLKFDTSIDSVSKVFSLLKDFFTVLISPVFFLFALLQDLGSLLVSFIEVLSELCGFDIFGTSDPGFGPWAGGGHGGGGGGIR